MRVNPKSTFWTEWMWFRQYFTGRPGQMPLLEPLCPCARMSQGISLAHLERSSDSCRHRARWTRPRDAPEWGISLCSHKSTWIHCMKWGRLQTHQPFAWVPQPQPRWSHYHNICGNRQAILIWIMFHLLMCPRLRTPARALQYHSYSWSAGQGIQEQPAWPCVCCWKFSSCWEHDEFSGSVDCLAFRLLLRCSCRDRTMGDGKLLKLKDGCFHG